MLLEAMLFLSAGILFLLGAYAFKFWRQPAFLPFFSSIIMACLWAFFYSLEIGAQGLNNKIFWEQLRIDVVPFIPVGLILTVIEYNRRARAINKRFLVLLLIIPFITLVINNTEPALINFHKNYSLISFQQYSLLAWEKGGWFWINIAYFYFILALTVYLLLDSVQNTGESFNTQNFLLLTALVIPGITGVFDVLGASPIPAFDLTPLFFSISGLLTLWALLKYQFLNLVPIALDLMITNMSDGVIILNNGNKIVQTNPALLKLLPELSGDSIGKSLQSIIPLYPQLFDSILNLIDAEIELKENSKWLNINISTIKDSRGYLNGKLVTIRDVTSQKNAEDALKNSEALYHTLISNMPTGLYLKDLEGKYIFVNEVYAHSYNKSAEDFINKTDFDLFPAETARINHRNDQQIITSGISFESIQERVEKNKGKVYTQVLKTPLTGTHSEIIGIQGLSWDITESKKVEIEIKQRLNELSTINAISDAIASKLDIDTILELACQKVRDALNAQGAYIAFYTKGDDYIQIPYRVYYDEVFNKINLPYQKGLTSIIIESGQPLIINENYIEKSEALGVTRFNNPNNNYKLPKSWVGAPIFSNNQVIGIISVMNYEIENAFNQTEVRLLTAIATNISIALHNAQLYETSQAQIRVREETENELKNSLNEISTISTISVAAATHLDMDSLIEFVGNKIEHTFNANSVFIALYHKETNLISYPYWTIFGEKKYAQPHSLGIGLTSLVIKNGEPLLLDEDFESKGEKLGANLIFKKEYGAPKTWLGVPIIVGEESIGIISIQDYSKEKSFDFSDVKLLVTIASNIGIAIQNAKLFNVSQNELRERKRAEEEAKQKAGQMSALNSVIQAITTGIELKNVLQTLLNQCRQIVTIDVFSVALYDQQSGLIKYIMYYEQGEFRAIQPHNINDNPSITSEIILNKKIVYLSDSLNPETKSMHNILRFGGAPSRTFLGIPLTVRDEIIGVLSVQSYQPDAYNLDQINLLETISSQAAIAIENARLYEEAHRRAEEMSSLYEIGMAITSKLDRNEVLQNLFRRCQRLLPMDAFYVAIYNADTEVLEHPLFYDLGKMVKVAPQKLNSDSGLSGIIINKRKTIYISDTADPEVIEQYPIVRVGGTATKSYVGVPLIARDQVIGVISMQNYEANAYSPEHIRLLETIALQATVAIENSALFENAQNELANRKKTEELLIVANMNLKSELYKNEKMKAQLQEQAIRDPLTNLFNRRYLQETLNREIGRAERENSQVCVIMIDIDNFKKLNDTYGHHIGDLFLKNLADILLSHIRNADIACRYGGEEFLVVLPGSPIEIAKRRAEEFRADFEKMKVQSNEKDLQATISLGVAAFPTHGKLGDEIIMQADQALYEAKSSGKNRVVLWKI